MNERKTEDLVEENLRENGYYNLESGVIVEKQKSDIIRINKLLKNASKRGKGAGKPEFIIHSTSHSNFLIVIECKADPRKHVSKTLDRYSEYAVDGVLLYAAYLSKDFDVMAIAVSGQTKAAMRISHYLHLKGTDKPVEFTEAREIVSIEEYYKAFINSDVKFRQDYDALLDYSRNLNNQLQAKKVTEAQRAFLISGILIALQSEAFRHSFIVQRTTKQLATSLLQAIRGEFEDAKLPQDRSEDLAQAFSFIPRSPALRDKDFFISLIKGIDDNINTFMRTHKFYDTIG